jgi:hypothetical protein
MKMENFVEFIRAGLIPISSIYENEKLCGIHIPAILSIPERKKKRRNIYIYI